MSLKSPRPPSHRIWPSALVFLCALSVAGASTPTADQPHRRDIPLMGDDLGLDLTQERQIGDRIAREIYRDPDYVDDPFLQDYLYRLWQPLLESALRRGDIDAALHERFAWRIFMDQSRPINASALPGGYLLVNLGLVGASQSPDELASVLAHELSHISQRHIARGEAEQSRMLPWMVVGMIAGILAASRNSQAGGAILVGSQAGAAQSQLSFSRDMEREADRVGFAIMREAGYAPQGFTALFERLQQAAQLNDSGSYPYLRTHPMTQERIADMQMRVQQSPVFEQQLQDERQWVHAIMSGRARALAKGSVEDWRRLIDQAQKLPAQKGPVWQQAGVLTAAALAEQRLGQNRQALRWAQSLRELSQGQNQAEQLARALHAELALAGGDAAGAARILEPDMGSLSVPKEQARASLLLWTQIQSRLGPSPRLSSAVQGLQLWTTTHTNDAPAWQALAQAYRAQGRMLSSLRAEGESHMAQYDWSGALDRFRAAQDHARSTPPADSTDLMEASIVTVRLEKARELRRQELEENKNRPGN